MQTETRHRPRKHREGRASASRASTSPHDELRFRSARMLLELARGTGAEWGAWIEQMCQFDAEVLRVERVSFWSFDDTGIGAHLRRGLRRRHSRVRARREALRVRAPRVLRGAPRGTSAERGRRRADPRDARAGRLLRGPGDLLEARHPGMGGGKAPRSALPRARGREYGAGTRKRRTSRWASARSSRPRSRRALTPRRGRGSARRLPRHRLAHRHFVARSARDGTPRRRSRRAQAGRLRVRLDARPRWEASTAWRGRAPTRASSTSSTRWSIDWRGAGSRTSCRGW